VCCRFPGPRVTEPEPPLLPLWRKKSGKTGSIEIHTTQHREAASRRRSNSGDKAVGAGLDS
jgi:hypothetical protein